MSPLQGATDGHRGAWRMDGASAGHFRAPFRAVLPPVKSIFVFPGAVISELGAVISFLEAVTGGEKMGVQTYGTSC